MLSILFSNVEILTHAWSPGGMMREIMEVPLPLAASRDLISFLTWEGENVRTLKIGDLREAHLPSRFQHGDVSLDLSTLKAKYCYNHV